MGRAKNMTSVNCSKDPRPDPLLATQKWEPHVCQDHAYD